MLTRQQSRLLDYLKANMTPGGVAPSFSEMQDALGLNSKSGVHRLIAGLEERGFIRRLHNRARAIEVLATPHIASAKNHDGLHCPHCGNSISLELRSTDRSEVAA